MRVALLRAALRLATEHGFASLGLREVSRAANIAPTSFYRHFADMSELGLALIRDHVEPLLHELAKGVHAGDPSASALGMARGMLQMVNDEPELVRFVLAERHGAFAGLRAGLARALELLALDLQRGTHPASHARLAADTVLALVCEGLGRALDAPASERESILERWTATMAHAWRREPT
ncbi:MAG: TetR family transcriptional regulator [Polyangiales bacterium]